MIALSPAAFQMQPEFELKHESIHHPDGLAFSNCGKWLAVANHGKQNIAIFHRRNRFLGGGKISFHPEPVTIIEDQRLRYPHSVTFTPTTKHVIVTNAGANYFCAYAPKRRWFGRQWSQVPGSQVIVQGEDSFREVNAANKMEGGPKGVVINRSTLAVCSPEIGVKIYSFREGWRQERSVAA
jgi:hypothetical protein